ncbi:porin [Paraburkholderia hayleyella]|uniref:porin n=1 Tax=Paraburkholderia hayleyella TaxID=2152889 RepID=UPI002483CE7E|nr:porin [Paraburkholderia hayleyella]
MKKHVGRLVLLIGVAAVAETAAAQSSVTLFGALDIALSYQTHVNPSGKSQMGLQQGNEGFLTGSRFGLKGNENLGGGWKAGFMLENGFLANNGKLDQQGQLFGRQAFVKLGHERYGEIALGRQYTTGNTMLYYVDPLGVGAAPTNSWQVYLVGQRYDNAFSYTGVLGPWQLIAEYAAGGIAGDHSARSSASFGLRYKSDKLTAVGSMQQTHDSQSRRARIVLGGWRSPSSALPYLPTTSIAIVMPGSTLPPVAPTSLRSPAWHRARPARRSASTRYSTSAAATNFSPWALTTA